MNAAKDQPAVATALWVATAGSLVGWAWTAIAGGSGLWLLITMGPWPPTNGWFALLSGLAACPLTASAAKRLAGVTLWGWQRLAAAAGFFIAGHIALLVWPHR